MEADSTAERIGCLANPDAIGGRLTAWPATQISNAAALLATTAHS
jgi:hypothetical protein